MKKKLALIILSVITAICCAVGLSACSTKNPDDGDNGGTEHAHNYNQMKTESTYLKSAATCTAKAVYYYSCSCGEKGTQTFEYGELAKHNYVDGVCAVCDDVLATGLYDADYNLLATYEESGMDATTDYTSSSGHPLTSPYYVLENTYKTAAHIVLPDTVTKIGSWAFANCTSLTSITIPDGVTSIGEYAFYQCSSLTSINIPDSVESIGEYAFTYCHFNYNVYDNAYYLGNTSNPYAILIKTKDTSITSCTIHENTRFIHSSAFYGCTSLTNIDIPDGVTSIGSYTFSQCYSLTNINLPNSVTSIGGSAFNDCSSLEKVNISDIASWCNISFGNNYANPLYYAYNLYLNNKLITELTIPDSVTSIGGSAFYNCTSLTSITIPDGVTSIGVSAFYNCNALTEINYNATECADLSYDNYVFYKAGQSGDGIAVTIGANVKRIPAYLFRVFNSNSSGIVSVVFEETSVCESIGNYAFEYCTSLTSITIPDSVTSIGECAFDGCYSLTSVTIGSGVKSVGSKAFYNCDKLIEIYNLSTLTITLSAKDVYTSKDAQSKLTTTSDGYIFYDDTASDNGGYYLMGYTGNETSITLPDKYKNSNYDIYDYAFYCCFKLTSVTIRGGVESIGWHAFHGCKSLTSITIPDSVTSIGNYAFYDMAYYNDESNWENGVLYIGKHLIAASTSISGAYEVKSGTLTIADDAFVHCSSLTSVNIPDSVTSIGYCAFDGCTKLTSVTIGSGVTSMGYCAFEGCTALTEINYNATELDCSDDKYIFSRAGENGTGITVNIGANVKKIPVCLFKGVSKIMSVKFAANSKCESIGGSAFHGCTSLTSINIPNSVTSIGGSAFYRCTSLTSITIPNSVTSIGNYAFHSCTALTGVYITDIASWCNISFGNNYANPLYYAYNLYLNGTLVTNLTIPSSVTSIGSYAFAYCTSLQSVTIGSGVKSIEKSAFSGCTSLTSVTFKNTSSWRVSDSSTATSGTNISSSVLSNTSTAATYLTSTYCGYYWKRT